MSCVEACVGDQESFWGLGGPLTPGRASDTLGMRGSPDGAGWLRFTTH